MSARLAGHAIVERGAPFVMGLAQPQRNKYDSWGFGLCQCGAISADVWGNDQRREWHAQHKNDERESR